MAIQSSQIDPDIAKALYEKEQKLLEETPSGEEEEDEDKEDENGEKKPKTPPRTPEELRAEAVLLKRGAQKGTTLKEKVGMTVSGAVLCALGYLAWSPIKVAAFFCFFIGVILLLGGIFTNLRKPRMGSQQGEVVAYTSDVLDALLPLLALTPVEKRYGELLTVLAREPSPLDEAARVEMIEQVTGLLHDHRALSARRSEIEAGLKEVNPDQEESALVAERDRLLAEASATSDPVIAEARRQTAQMFDERIEDARIVRQTVERMRAQEEAIYETMGTLHSSLMRLSLAPASLHRSDTASLRATVDRARRQTVAVEQAVEEVITLGRE